MGNRGPVLAAAPPMGDALYSELDDRHAANDDFALRIAEGNSPVSVAFFCYALGLPEIPLL
jgi:hypothetical protein